MKKSIKILVGIGAFLGFLIVLALILPFLIDLNKFKPQIQAAVAENVHAQLDFESARLQIFPRIGVKLKNVSITNTDPVFKGTKLFSVGSLLVDAQFMPLLKKKLVGEVLIEKPEIRFVKSKTGNNATALKKETAASPAAPTAQPQQGGGGVQAPQSPQEKQENLRFIKENVLLTAVIIKDAKLLVQEMGDGAQAKEPVRVDDLDIAVKNIGLDRDIDLKIATIVKINEAGSVVEGPFVIQSKQRITLNDKGLERLTFDGGVQLDDLSIRFKDAFKKEPKIPLHMTFKGVLGENHLDLEGFEFVIHDLVAKASGKITDLKLLRTEMTLALDDKNLSSFGDLLPQHKQMLVNARIKLDATLKGDLADPLTVKLNAKLDTDLTGSDLRADLAVNQVKPFRGSLHVDSRKFDFDRVMGPFMAPAPSQAAAAAGQQGGKEQGQPSTATGQAAAGKTSPAEPAKDFALTPEQKAQLAGMDFLLQAKMGQMVAKGFDIRNFIVDMEQKSLLMQLNRFTLSAFEGTVTAKGQVDLSPNPVAFNLVLDMNNIKPDNVMVFIKPEHKDVLKGKANIHVAVRGSGTTIPSLNKTLNGKGNYLFREGELNTPSIAQALQKKFNEFVSGQSVAGVTDSVFKSAEKVLANPLVAKIPGKEQFDVNQYKEKYKSFSKTVIADNGSVHKDLKDSKGEFEIKNGRIYIDSKRDLPAGLFDTHASVGLDMSLGGRTIYTASEGTKKRMLQQSPYASLVFDEKGGLVVEADLAGTVMDPKVVPKFDRTKESFNRNATALVEKEVKKAAEDYIKKILDGQKKKLSEDLQKKVDEQIKKHEGESKKKAEEEIKGKLKGLFGK